MVKIRWRIEAFWPINKYGLREPFTVPDDWVCEDSGAGMGERDMSWATPVLPLTTLTQILNALKSEGVTFIIEAHKPDWLYDVPNKLMYQALDAWDNYTRALLDGKNIKPPSRNKFLREAS